MQVPTDSPHGSGCPGGATVSAGRVSHLKSAFAIAASAAAWTIPPHPVIEVLLLEARDWRPWLADAHALLSAAETERTQQRRLAADRDALALAYALHRLVLGKVLDREPSEVSLHRDERGCPRVAGDMAYTSLSHADGLIAIAVALEGPIGVDVEPPGRATVMPEIARSVCHRSEVAGLDALDEPARAAALLALWVRKEALLKAAGVGLAVSMESFAAPESRTLLLPGLFSREVQVRMLKAGDRCVAAAAGPTGMSIQCCWLRPRVGRGLEDSCLQAAAWKVAGTTVSMDGP